MKRIIYTLCTLVVFLIALFVLWGTFTNPHEEYYSGEESFPFGKGNASDQLREEISTQLKYFEKGYLDRNTEIVDEYCEALISKENILILGTMPAEIYSGFEGARDLIESDWLYWGDVYYLMDQANISVSDSVAWISTIGYVEFDLSSLLVLPLRYTALMVNEDTVWKFQQMQFQFDLDNMKILLTIILLSLSSIVLFIRVLFLIVREYVFKKVPKTK